MPYYVANLATYFTVAKGHLAVKKDKELSSDDKFCNKSEHTMWVNIFKSLDYTYVNSLNILLLSSYISSLKLNLCLSFTSFFSVTRESLFN